MDFSKALFLLKTRSNARWIERRAWNSAQKLTIDTNSDGETILKSSKTGKAYRPDTYDMMSAEDWEVIRG